VIRVITYFEDTVSQISDILHTEFEIEGETSVDKKKSRLESFSYKHIQYLVRLKSNRRELTEYKRSGNKKFEIQICSMLQDAWAGIEKELGYDNTGFPEDSKRDLYRVGALLEMADIEFLKIRSKFISQPIGQQDAGTAAEKKEAEQATETPAPTGTFADHLKAVAPQQPVQVAPPAPIAEIQPLYIVPVAPRAEQPAYAPVMPEVAQPIYAAPAPVATPPVYVAPPQAAQPVYTPPVMPEVAHPVYTVPAAPQAAQPVYTPAVMPEVAQTVYAAPAPQVYVPPVMPEVAQPVYTAPAPQPQAAYVPPVMPAYASPAPQAAQPVYAPPAPVAPQPPVENINNEVPTHTKFDLPGIAAKAAGAIGLGAIAEQIIAAPGSISEHITEYKNNIIEKISAPVHVAAAEITQMPEMPAMPESLTAIPEEAAQPIVDAAQVKATMQQATNSENVRVENLKVTPAGNIEKAAEASTETDSVPFFEDLIEEENTKAVKPAVLDENAPITDASLKEYVLKSKLLKQVDTQIAERAGAKINGDIDIEGDVERLRFLKVYTLKQLHDKIKDNTEDIVAFAEKWIGKDNGGSFDSGISLFYLEYLLVGKKNDPAFAVEYVVKFISDNDYSARYIIPTYNSIRNTEASNFSHLTLK
jgi:hypothetical protein